ncbi:hypothetical protein GGTG_00631 [Gaeumannomyces tritici R3-111a-1]|uniref:Uncharacterized protein n=2 Tax=Magnaporthaceae TaxID=81093 RepID=A0A0C4DZS9_MAGP6|nr:hypothetical protein GGTG_00631 [Gaeumannomyces tritici R3-111a-1]EJT80637.1 hypothetical protein GGTG_00631 [Gaeumannomyces tritici R3-111a-1]KLU86574.1 hypothetical protein MAPG_05586 [Magnaporthiopsis poae ATCC 64411]
MVKPNDVIAIIVIIIFIILVGIAFGIYRLVMMARNSVTATTTSSSGETSIVDDN